MSLIHNDSMILISLRFHSLRKENILFQVSLMSQYVFRIADLLICLEVTYPDTNIKSVTKFYPKSIIKGKITKLELIHDDADLLVSSSDG
ncbi:unnamed protein product [Rhizophagus irregularis]|uniref:Uncharacterized protein n=1 Tax=Rhizophagus irregularis TaxID=588596 RepID=A0A916A1I8_9GLOM|nr:unnamed protein product [Rhizophagus irregularis]